MPIPYTPPSDIREGEVFKRVNKFKYYAVSNQQRVWNGRDKRYLKPYANQAPPNDYLRLRLRNFRGDKRSFYLHRLVALYHVPGRTRTKRVVNHKGPLVDEQGRVLILKRHYCWAINLEWLTEQQNLQLRFEDIEPPIDYGDPPF